LKQQRKADLSQNSARTTKKPEPVFIPVEVFKQTLQPERFEQNVFIQNLLTRVAFPFETKDIEKVISLYYLGTVSNGYRAGASTFPFIDLRGNVRAIQVKQFNENNHTTGTDFLHSIIEKHHAQTGKPLSEWLKMYNKSEIKVSCLFGEHLLGKYPSNPVALVEAPKTAVYCTLYFGIPNKSETLIWLAVYNKSSFSIEKLKALQGRDVYIFPDLSKNGNTFNEWQRKAREIEKRLPGIRFIFSDLLEQLAPETDKLEGNDLADYLIKQDWRLFRKRTQQEKPTPETRPELELVETKTREKCEKCESLKKTFFPNIGTLSQTEGFKTERIEHYKKEQSENWEQDISDLEHFFKTIILPIPPIKLNPVSTIVDITKFIETHFSIVKAQNGKKVYLPYLNRLQDLQEHIENNLN